MIIKFVLPLSDPAATIENVGGVGMSLAKMSPVGLPVATGFRVTTEAFRRFVSENGVQPRILAVLEKVNASDPVALEAVSRKIHSTKSPCGFCQPYTTGVGHRPALANHPAQPPSRFL
jgi:phosphoenolpyruvate synthase/pyruvate phosphate dikinase